MHSIVHLQAIASHLAVTLTKDYDTGRWAHLNVKLLHFYSDLDAGKSTIGGHIMYLTGMVDKRTLEKYEREAKEKNRESW